MRQFPEDARPDRLLAELIVPLRPAANRIDYPGYGEVNPAVIPGVSKDALLRVEIVPLTAGLRYWAFASVTNNATQHVTTVTPQP